MFIMNNNMYSRYKYIYIYMYMIVYVYVYMSMIIIIHTHYVILVFDSPLDKLQDKLWSPLSTVNMSFSSRCGETALSRTF